MRSESCFDRTGKNVATAGLRRVTSKTGFVNGMNFRMFQNIVNKQIFDISIKTRTPWIWI